MNNFYIIELGLLISIIIVQIIIFIATYLRIRTFEKIFYANFDILKVKIPFSTLREVEPEDILTDVEKLKENLYGEEVKLIENPYYNNVVLRKIFNSINIYILQNRQTATEFTVFRDIVERNCHSKDESISIMLPIPLYLGLLGTILGVVIGLLQISFGDTSKFMEGDTIPHFLQAVMTAMVASGAGLFFTIINTGVVYKKAKANLEEDKNDLYNFLQTQLIPIFTQNITSNINSLQSNLDEFSDKFISNIQSFNNNFDNNVKTLSNIFTKNYEAIKIQADVLDRLENIDIAELAKANIDTYRELRKSALEFEKFGDFLNKVNTFINCTEKLTTEVNNLFGKVQNVEVNTDRIAQSIIERINESNRIMEFVDSHFSELEKNREALNEALAQNQSNIRNSVQLNRKFWQSVFIENKDKMNHAVIDLNKTLSDSIEDLKKITIEKVKAIQHITISEDSRLEQAVQNYKGKLNHLEYLETISKDIRIQSKSESSLQEEIISELQKLNKGIGELAKKGKQSNIKKPQMKKKVGFLRRMFNKI